MFFALSSKWTITDNKSANGTKLNDTWLQPMQPHLLNDRDVIQFGPDAIQVLMLNCFIREETDDVSLCDPVAAITETALFSRNEATLKEGLSVRRSVHQSFRP